MKAEGQNQRILTLAGNIGNKLTSAICFFINNLKKDFSSLDLYIV